MAGPRPGGRDGREHTEGLSHPKTPILPLCFSAVIVVVVVVVERRAPFTGSVLRDIGDKKWEYLEALPKRFYAVVCFTVLAAQFVLTRKGSNFYRQAESGIQLR